MISITNEFSPLRSVIIGRGSPYQRDKEQVRAEMREYPLVPETERKTEVLALTYPTEDLLEREYAGYLDVLGRYDIQVHLADPEAAYFLRLYLSPGHRLRDR